LCPISHYEIAYEEEFPDADNNYTTARNYTTVINDVMYKDETEYIRAGSMDYVLGEELTEEFSSYKTIIEAKAGKAFAVFEPVMYTQLGVSSRLFYIKYKVDGGDYLHAKLMKPLPGAESPNYSYGVGHCQRIDWVPATTDDMTD